MLLLMRCVPVVLLLAQATPTPPPMPLTLQAAVEYAQNNLPAVRAARAHVAASQAGVDLARTSFLPRTDMLVAMNRATRNNVFGLLLPQSVIPPISGPVLGSNDAGSTWGSSAGVLFAWEPFDFGLRQANVAIANAQASRADAVLTLTRFDAGLRAADAFLALLASQEAVGVALANVDRTQVLAASVGVLVLNQLRPGADESRAQAELAAARIQLTLAEQAREINRTNLAQALGVPGTRVEIAAGALLDMPTLTPAASSAADRHPLAVTQTAAIDLVHARETALDRSFFPKFNFQSAFSARGTGALTNGTFRGGLNGLAPTAPNWAVGLNVTFPLFDFASIRERKRIEVENERSEMAVYDSILQKVTADTERARVQIEGARRVAENTPVQLNAARLTEQQSRARYQNGLTTILEVADSQRLLLQAEIADALARLSVWRALLADAAARGDLSPLFN